MSWQSQLRGDSLSCLLETDSPGVRYLALRDLLGLPAEAVELKSARKAARKRGPIAEILARMNEQGYWVKPGTGYSPKYKSTVWQLIFLAQLGADGAHPGVRKGCDYVLAHS